MTYSWRANEGIISRVGAVVLETRVGENVEYQIREATHNSLRLPFPSEAGLAPGSRWMKWPRAGYPPTRSRLNGKQAAAKWPPQINFYPLAGRVELGLAENSYFRRRFFLASLFLFFFTPSLCALCVDREKGASFSLSLSLSLLSFESERRRLWILSSLWHSYSFSRRPASMYKSNAPLAKERECHPGQLIIWSGPRLWCRIAVISGARVDFLFTRRINRPNRGNFAPLENSTRHVGKFPPFRSLALCGSRAVRYWTADRNERPRTVCSNSSPFFEFVGYIAWIEIVEKWRIYYLFCMGYTWNWENIGNFPSNNSRRGTSRG